MKGRVINGLLLVLGISLIVIAITSIVISEKKKDIEFYEEVGLFEFFSNSDNVDFEVVPVKPKISNYREWGNDNLSLMFNMPKKDGDEYALKLWIRRIERYNAEFEQAVLFVYKNGENEYSVGHYHPGRSGSKEEIGEMAGKVLKRLIHEKGFFEEY